MERSASNCDGLMNVLRNRWMQWAALTALLSGIGINALRLKYCVLDNDIWWHLKVGDWIVDHLALPHTGVLSRTAADRAWVAYSWGYEVLLSRAYRWFGLIGIGVYGVALTIAVVFAIFWMLWRLSGRYWTSCILAGIVCSAFLFNGMPRPVFFSQILYCLTLTVIFQAQRKDDVKLLYWLPAVFLLWANLHIQFIYGLFAFALFVGVNLIQRMLTRFGIKLESIVEPSLPVTALLAVFAACVIATLIGPNFYHPYEVVFAYTRAKFPYNVISELQPLSFRGYSHFAELFIAAAGFYAVGWRRRLDVFKVALLAVASMVAFRTMRDAWFICLSAAACVVDCPALESQEEEQVMSWPGLAGVFGVVAVLLLFAAPLFHFDTRGLDRAISADYPVNAINFLRRNPVAGPLYNNLNWGGFLMWYLPELPVAVDGRNDLYGDDLDRQFYDSQCAFPSYASDPYLDGAGVVVLQSDLPLAKILTRDQRFQLVYQDQIATVFAHR